MLAACAEPRRGGPLVRLLGTVAPLPEMPHAKRVRKHPEDASQLELLLCAAPCEGGAALPAELAAFLAEHSLQTHIVQVPSLLLVPP